MKAITITQQGTPVAGNLAVVDGWADPTPGPGEVTVRTEASALNHLDVWIGQGIPGIDRIYPLIGGADGCGIVDAVGEGVDSSWIGRRVLLNAARWTPSALHPDITPAPSALSMIGEEVHGTHAAFFLAPVTNVIEIGDTDPVEAAAFGLVHLTAWGMLVSKADLKPGQWVLITGIGGGVALAALNIARWLGCPTIVTSRHQWKLDRALECGADHAVLDEGEDWSRTVRSLTGKRGVDVCVDSVGQAIHRSCLQSLAREGTFVTCGSTTGGQATTDLTRIFWNQLSILGSSMGTMKEFRSVLALLQNGAITPNIDSIWNVNEADKAWERIESGEQFGKVVVRWP